MKSEWARVLAEALVKEDEVPRGWKRSEAIANETGKSVTHTMNLLRPLVVSGRVKRKKFIIRLGKITRATWHYKVCTPEDFDIESDLAISPQDQMGARKHVGGSGRPFSANPEGSNRVNRRQVPERPSRTRRQPVRDAR